ncbi:uncharacterized protein LOC109614395 [Musca domestica]|uniref:Uncharacterized protein LOC109614395 n=1 Tax=Musca domestica TaxID=7370 RepID=A0ABM3VI90_MUSDO|nr:uncharacterized protein LOC109614395 [Musca domestica]
MLKLLFLLFCGGFIGVAGEILCPPNETLVQGKCRPLVADVYCDNVKCGENMKCDEWNQCICLEGYMEYLDEDDGMKIKCANLEESVVDYTTENFFIGENFGSVESVKKFISTPDFGEVTESSKIGQKEKLEEPRENVKENNFEKEKLPKNSENQISNTGLKREEYNSSRSPEKMLSEKTILKSIENVLPSEEVDEYFERNSPQNPGEDLEIQGREKNKSEIDFKNIEKEKFSKDSQELVENGAQSGESLTNKNGNASENDISKEEEADEFEQNSPQNPEEESEIQDHEKNKSEVDFNSRERENLAKGPQENSNSEDIENGAQSRDSLRNENEYSSENDISLEEEAKDFERNSPHNPEENLKIHDREKIESELDFENRKTENFSKRPQENSNSKDIENGAQSRDSLRHKSGYASESDMSSEEETEDFERNSPPDPEEDSEIQDREKNKSGVENRETEIFSKGLQEKSKDPQPILKENKVEHGAQSGDSLTTEKGYATEIFSKGLQEKSKDPQPILKENKVEHGAQSGDSLTTEKGYANENNISSEEGANNFKQNSPQNPEEDLEIQDREKNKSEVDFENPEIENFSKGSLKNANDPQPTLKEYTLEPIENGVQSGDSVTNENEFSSENDMSSEEVKEDFERNSPQNPGEDSEIQDREKNKSEVDFENRETENFSNGPQKNSNDSQPTLKEYTLELIENGAQSGDSFRKENGHASEKDISSEEETNDFQRNSPQNPEKDLEIHDSEENKSEVDFENPETENFSKGPQKNSKEPQPTFKEYTPEHMENGAKSGNSLQNPGEDSEIQDREKNKSGVDFENREIENFSKDPQKNSNDPQSNLKENITEYIENGAQSGDSMTNKSAIAEPESYRDHESHIEKMQVSPEQNQEIPKKFGEYEHPTTTSQKEDKDIENPIDLETEVVSDDDERKISDGKPKENQELKMANPADEKLPSPENNEEDISKQELDLGSNNFLGEEFVTPPSSEEFKPNLKLNENIESRFQFPDPSSATNKTLDEENERPLAPSDVEVKHEKANENQEPAILFSAIQNEPGSVAFSPKSENSRNEKSLEPTNDSKIPTTTTTTTLEPKNLHLINFEEPLVGDAQKIPSEVGHELIVPYNAKPQIFSEISELEQLPNATESSRSVALETKNWTSSTQRSTSGEDISDSKKGHETDQNRHDEKRSDTITSERGTEYRSSTTEVNPSGVSQANVTTEGEFNGESEENQSRNEEERPHSMSLGRGQIKIKEYSSTTSTTEKNLRSLDESSVPSEGELHEIFDENQGGIEKGSRSPTASQSEKENASKEKGQIPNEEERSTIIASEREREYRPSITEKNLRGLTEINVPSEGEPDESLNENQNGIEKERRSFTASPGEREDTSRELETTDERSDSAENLDDVEVLSEKLNRFVGSQMTMPENYKDHENEEDNSEEKQNHGQKERTSQNESEIGREYWLSTTEAVSEKISMEKNVGLEEKFNSDSHLPERYTLGEVESSKGSSEKIDDVRVVAEEPSAFVGSTTNIPQDFREKESLGAEPSQQEGESLHSTASEFERELAEISSNKSPKENIASKEKFVNSDFILPESVAPEKSATSIDFSENSKERTQDSKNYSEEKQSQEKEEKTSSTESEIGREYWHDTTEGLLNRFSIGRNVGLEEKLNSDSRLPERKSLGEFETNDQNFSTDNQSQQESPSSTASDSQREQLPRTTDNILEEEFPSKEKINSDSNHPEKNTLAEMKKTEGVTDSNFLREPEHDSSENFHDIEVLSENQNGFVGSQLKMLNVSNAEEIGVESEPQNNSQEVDSNGNFAKDQHPSSSLDVDEKKVKGKISQIHEEASMFMEMDKRNGIAEEIQDLHKSRTSNQLAVENPENFGGEAVIDKHLDVGEQNERPMAEINPNKNNNNEGYSDQDSKPGHDTYQIREDIPTEFENDPSPEATREWEREKQLPESNFKKIQNKENNSQMQRELQSEHFTTISSLEHQSESERKETSTSSLQHQNEPEHKGTSSPDGKERQFVDQYSTTRSHETQTEPEPKETLSLNGKEREFKSQDLTPTSRLEHQQDPEVHDKNESLDHTKTLELQHQKAPAITHNYFKSEDPKSPGKEEENPDTTITTTSTSSRDGNFTETSTKTTSEEINSSSTQEEFVDPSTGKDESLEFIKNNPSQIFAQNASQDLKDQNAISENNMRSENVLQGNGKTISPHYPEKAHQQESPVHQEDSSKKADCEDIISSSQEEDVDSSIGKDESQAFIEDIPSQIFAQNTSQDLKDQNAISDKNMKFKEGNHNIMIGTKVEYIPQDNVTTISPQYPDNGLRLENTDHLESDIENGLSTEEHKDPVISSSFNDNVQKPTISLQYPEDVLPQYAEKNLRLENTIHQESETENGISLEDKHKDPQYPEDVLPQYPEKTLRLENTDHQENETENGLSIDDHKDPFISPSFNVGIQQSTISPQYPVNVLPQYPEKELRLETPAHQESETENGIFLEDKHKDPKYPVDVHPQYPEKELRLKTTAHQESDTENGISMKDKHKDPQYHEDVLPQYPQKELRLENTAHQEIETESGISMEDHKDTFISKIPNSSHFTSLSNDSEEKSPEEDTSELENSSQPEVLPKIGGGGNSEITPQKSLPPTTADPSNFEMNAGAANSAGRLVPTTANPHLQNSTKSRGIVTNVKVTTLGPDSHTSRPIDPAAVGKSTTGSPIHKSQGTSSKEDDYKKELALENAVVVKTASKDTSNNPGNSGGHQILTDASGENTVPVGTETGSTKGYDMPKDNNRNHADFVENPIPIEDAKSPFNNHESGVKYYQEEDDDETEITTPTSGSSVTAVHNLEETQIRTQTPEPIVTGKFGIYIPEDDMTNSQTEKPREILPSESLISEGNILVIHDSYNRPKPLPTTAGPILNASKEMPKSMQEKPSTKRKTNKEIAENSNAYPKLDTEAQYTVAVVPNVPSRNHKAISNTTPKTMQQSLNTEQISSNQYKKKPGLASIDPNAASQTSSKPKTTNLKSDLDDHKMESSTETMPNGLNASHPSIKGMSSEEVNPADVAKILDETLAVIDDKSQTPSTESVLMTTRNVPVGKIASLSEEEKKEEFSGNAISVSLNLHNSNKTSLELNPKYFGENVKENSNQTADDAPKNMLHISNKNTEMPMDRTHLASTESALLENEESSQVNSTSGMFAPHEIEFKTFNKSISEFAPKSMPHIVNGHPISEIQTSSTESSALQEREFSSEEENLNSNTNGSLTQDSEAQVPMDHGSVKIDSHGSSTVKNETLENELQTSNANSNESIKTKAGNQDSDSTIEIANTLPRVPLSQNGDSQLRGNEMMSNSIIGNGDEKKIAFEAGRNSPTTVSPKDSDSSSNSSSSAHFVPEFKSFFNISQHGEENSKSKDTEDSSSEMQTTLKPENYDLLLEKTLKVEPYSGTLNAKNADDFSSEKIVNFATTEAEELLGEKNPPELISNVSDHGERFTSTTMEPEDFLGEKNHLEPNNNASTPEDSHYEENLTTTTNEPGTTSPTTAEASVPLRIPTYLNAENPPKDNANGNDNSSIGSTGQNLDSQATEFTSPGIEEIILINAENPLKNNSHGDEYSLIGSTGQNLDNQILELTTSSIGPKVKESNLINTEDPLKNNSLGEESTSQHLDNQASDLTTPSIGRETRESNSIDESNRGDKNASTIWREITPHTEDTSGENSSSNAITEHQKVTATEFDLAQRLETHFATDRETNKNSDHSLPDLFSTTTTNDFQSEDIAGRASTEDSKVQKVEPKTLGEMAGHFSMDIDFDEIPGTTTSHENTQEEVIDSKSARGNSQQFETSSDVAENSKNSKSRNAFEGVTRLSANISKGLENNLTLEEFGTSTSKISVKLPINLTSDQTLKEVETPKISEELPINPTSDQELEDTLTSPTTPHTNEDIFEMFNNKNRSDEKTENSLESNSSGEAGSSSLSSKTHNFDTTTTSIFDKIFKQLNFSDADTKEIESNSSESNSSKEAASASSSSKTDNFDGYDTTATSIFEELYKTFKQQDSSPSTETKEIEKSSESNSSDEAASASSSSKTYNFDDYDTTATSIFEEFYKTFKQQGSFPNTDIKEIEKSSESNSSKEAASSFSSSEPHNLDEYETVTTSIFQELYKTFKQQHNLSDTEKQKPPPQTTTERTGNFSGTDNQSKNQTTTALPLSEGTLEGQQGTSKEDKNSWTNAGNTEVLNVNETSLSGGENSDKETISSNANKYNTEENETTVRNNPNKILIGKTQKEREKILKESGAYETTTTEYNLENNNNTTSTTKQSNHSKLTTVLRSNTTTLPPIHAKEANHIPKNRRKPIMTYAPPPNENEHENTTRSNDLADYCLKPENICSPLCCGENTVCSSQQGCQCREGFREMAGENRTRKHCVAVSAEPHKIPSSYIFIGVICLILALIYMSVKYFNVTQVGRHNV